MPSFHLCEELLGDECMTTMGRVHTSRYLQAPICVIRLVLAVLLDLTDDAWCGREVGEGTRELAPNNIGSIYSSYPWYGKDLPVKYQNLDLV